MCNAASYRFRDIRGQMVKFRPKISVLGILGAPNPKGEKTCPVRYVT